MIGSRDEMSALLGTSRCWSVRDTLFSWMQKYRACRVIRRVDGVLHGQSSNLWVQFELTQREYCRLFVLDLPWLWRQLHSWSYVDSRRRCNYDLIEMVRAHYAARGWHFWVGGSWETVLQRRGD